MQIRNALIFGEDFVPRKGDLRVHNGVIAALGETLLPEPNEETVDAQGLYLVPGFVDMHIHGGMGASVEDADPALLHAMSQALAAQGVTSFCPTTMTLPPEHLERCFCAVSQAMGHEPGAYIHGVHMEGPYIALGKRGAQNARFVRLPDVAEVTRLRALAPLRVLSMAPELPGAAELARALAPTVRVAMAHTEASLRQAERGLAEGFSHATHLFCAMPPLHHRAPGVVGAIFADKNATAELICDGVHVDPAMVRLAFRLLGAHRAVVVSDAVAAAGLPEGRHWVGGTEFVRARGAVYCADGETLAGGACNLLAAFRNLLAWGLDAGTALRAVSINPARVVGANKKTGSIAPGKAADLLLLRPDWTLAAVWVRGKLLKDDLQTPA
jgi:N-acetylglucosamine-6-phosphate deacetylase